MSFFKKIESWVASIFKKAPSWETIAKSTILYVAPLLETIVALADPAAAPAVDAIVDKIKVGLAAASVTLSDAGPVPTLSTILASVNTNIGQLEAAAQIKDPATQAKLTATVNLISGEIQAILSAIPPTAATA